MPTQAESPRVAALLLAAGASRRMGRDKLSLPFGQGTVLEETARGLAGAPVTERVLVTREPPAFDAAKLGFRTISIGDEAGLGMHRSLKRGIQALTTPADAVLVCLGDQPFLRAADYAALLAAYALGLPERDLLFPVRAGRRGNPAVLPAACFAEILAAPDGDHGCRYLFDRYPARARAWEAPSEGFTRDLDTPEEYLAWSK